MEFMNQPFSGQLGDRLIELLGLTDYHSLNIAVAFAKNSGVLRIKNSLARFRERGGVVNVFVGVDGGGTSYEALTALLLHTDSLNVVHSETNQTFHPKIFQFAGESNGLLVVGSHNLTGGGLWTNIESSLHIPINGSSVIATSLAQSMSDFFQNLSSLGSSFMPITSQEEIDALLKNHYVSREVTNLVSQANNAKQNGTGERLFGSGVPARLPSLTSFGKSGATVTTETSTQTAATDADDVNQTIWFETRKMTGGSRNILDLSMRSLIENGDATGTPFDLGEEKFMRGGVEFFGISPHLTNQTKTVTINFKGEDYSNNTILFPTGNNPNGTWRLQIKGISSTDRRITEAFRAEGQEHFLVEKLIAFTKVQDDYFHLSVFPMTELESFKAASRILARNGNTQNARFMGLL